MEAKEKPKLPKLTYEQIMDIITKDVASHELPERMEYRDTFVRAAKSICERNGFDLELQETDVSIIATVSFDAPTPLENLRRLISVSDEVSLFLGTNNRDVTLTLEYYTHAVYRRGRMVHP